ncbi:MAG: hypothetical protein NT051_06905 [Candidatus Micrarchaeota archaeon]|nr:hypothetical protein [Candidatus Micrarchaeota archaeon]
MPIQSPETFSKIGGKTLFILKLAPQSGHSRKSPAEASGGIGMWHVHSGHSETAIVIGMVSGLCFKMAVGRWVTGASPDCARLPSIIN